MPRARLENQRLGSVQPRARAVDHRLSGFVAIFYVFLWASAFVPSKIASTESSPLWFLAARFAVAGLLLALAALALRRPFPRTGRAWLIAIVLGILSNALYLGLTYTALGRLASGLVSIIASTNPLVLAIVAPRLLHEPLNARKGIGLAFGFGGVLAIVVTRAGTQTVIAGDALLAFGGVCASVASTVLFKRAATGQDLLSLSAVQMLAACIALLPIAWLSGGAPHAHIDGALIASFAYLVVVLSIGATLIWFWLLGRGEASRVSAFYYLTPAFGLALSALILHERVTTDDLIGLVAIAAGIVLVQRS